MEEIGAAFVTALKLIITGDPEVLSITLRSIIISGSATILSALIFIPAGSAVFFSEFPGKKGLVNLINTLFSVPTVFVGLVVFIAISR
ncbi:MAG: ABC transporter permease, partial [Dehalococcoidia bacterium]|nr:ABC transporter permease [Dehalococcoidia bacterium]